jgi:hypothetical protein
MVAVTFMVAFACAFFLGIAITNAVYKHKRHA